MIKVFPASFVSYKGKYQALESKNKNNQPQMNSMPQAKGINYNGISLVSFKGGSYYDTLNENYFKLPEGAEPDIYQKQSASSIYKGNDLLVTAPTGTGKTAIAYYAITKNTTNDKMQKAADAIEDNLENGKRTFYTTPLKALSNEKYRQLQGLYGEENVGILTGDVKVNAQAPIVVMTTEIYRNMVLGEKFKENTGRLNDVKTVIFDELHYLGDVDRGSVWEQSIILSDPKTQLLSLSATIGNNKEIANWMSQIRGQKTDLVDVPPEKRHVPLDFENIRVKAQTNTGKMHKSNGKSKFQPKGGNSDSPDKTAYFNVVDTLREKDRLPAIFFVFSKKFSKILLSSFTEEGRELTTPQERKQIDETLQKYRKEYGYIGEAVNTAALFKGYAIHNSGLLPVQKKMIEELFQKKLLKVVIATETLAAGINMPARTTVISEVRKPTSLVSADENGDGKRYLTSNEFHQMAGRAGRRGIDTQGYVYTMYTNEAQRQKFDELTKSLPGDIKSQFNPNYSFIANYYGMTQDDSMMKDILSKSLGAYNKDYAISKANSNLLFKTFETRKSILQNTGFVNFDNTLTLKGKSLAMLSGYEQIPVINAVFNKSLANLAPDELAGAVGMMANISDKFDDNLKGSAGSDKNQRNDKMDKKYEQVNELSIPMEYFARQLNNNLRDYNKMIAKNQNHIDVEADPNVSLHLYTWANLNANNPNPDKNWKELYRGDLYKTIKFEGVLYREIMQTIDLLKQISKIAEFAEENSEKEKDIEYFSKLRQTAQKSLDLIDRGVANSDEV